MDMFRSRDLRVYPYFDQEENEVNNPEIHTILETYRLHERDDSEDRMATMTRHSQFRQLLGVPRNESKTPPNEIYRIRSTEKFTYQLL